MASILERVFGDDLQKLEKAEREETAAVLRLRIESDLQTALATNPPARVATFSAAQAGAGRLAVTVRVAGGAAKATKRHLVFARRGGGVRLVDSGEGEFALVGRLRAQYPRTKRKVRWAPLAFAWLEAAPYGRGIDKRIPKPVWRAPLPAPNPVWPSREALTLGVEPPPLTGVPVDGPAAKGAGDPWLVVSLTGDGVVSCRPGGRYGPARAFELGSEDPGKQDDAIQALVDCLATAASLAPQQRNPDGSSKLRALIHADRRAKWKYVQWVMQACAHPKVKVMHIAFALRRGEAGAAALATERTKPFGRLDVDLPTAAWAHHQPRPPKVKIKLFRRDMHLPEQAHTIMKVDAPRQIFKLPAGWRGRAAEAPQRIEQYDRTIAQLRRVVDARIAAHGGTVTGEIVAPPPKGGSVPYEDIMQMVHMLRQAGVHTIYFEGAATPLTARERAARSAKRGR